MHPYTMSLGTLTIIFDGASQLSFVDGGNPRNKENVIIYYCGQSPSFSGTSHFGNIENYIIYSPTISSFLGKSTTYGTCPVFIGNEYHIPSNNHIFDLIFSINNFIYLLFISLYS